MSTTTGSEIEVRPGNRDASRRSSASTGFTRTRNWMVPFASVTTAVFVIGAWVLVTRGTGDGPSAIPAPEAVVSAFGEWHGEGYQGANLLGSVGTSAVRMIVGWVLAVSIGAVLGIAMGLSLRTHQAVNPWFQFYRALPPLGYLSLLVVWFGVGETSKVVLLVLAGLPPVVVAATAAVAGIRRERLSGARSLGLSGWTMFRFVIFPSCLPGIITGARVSIGFVIAALIGAEMIAANSGVAWVILRATNKGNMAMAVAAIITMSVLAIVCDRLLRSAQLRLTPWVGRS